MDDRQSAPIQNAHAYMADGLLVVEWRRPDSSGYLLMIDDEGGAQLVVAPVDGHFVRRGQTIDFNVSDGWPAEFLKDVDIEKDIEDV